MPMLRLRADYRCGGVPGHYLAEEADNMLVAGKVRKSVVFVCYRTEHGFELEGAAFFVSVHPGGTLIFISSTW